MIELEPAPIKGADETSDAFERRQLQWWRASDVALRSNQAERCAAWSELIVPTMQPTLNRIADAWDALDVRLGDLAAALRPAPAPTEPPPAPAPTPEPIPEPVPAPAGDLVAATVDVLLRWQRAMQQRETML